MLLRMHFPERESQNGDDFFLQSSNCNPLLMKNILFDFLCSKTSKILCKSSPLLHNPRLLLGSSLGNPMTSQTWKSSVIKSQKKKEGYENQPLYTSFGFASHAVIYFKNNNNPKVVFLLKGRLLLLFLHRTEFWKEEFSQSPEIIIRFIILIHLLLFFI